MTDADWSSNGNSSSHNYNSSSSSSSRRETEGHVLEGWMNIIARQSSQSELAMQALVKCRDELIDIMKTERDPRISLKRSITEDSVSFPSSNTVDKKDEGDSMRQVQREVSDVSVVSDNTWGGLSNDGSISGDVSTDIDTNSFQKHKRRKSDESDPCSLRRDDK